MPIGLEENGPVPSTPVDGGFEKMMTGGQCSVSYSPTHSYTKVDMVSTVYLVA